MKEQISIYKGHIIFTKTPYRFTIIENGYILVKNGKVFKVFNTLPEEYKQMQISDIAGGHTISILEAMVYAMATSKMILIKLYLPYLLQRHFVAGNQIKMPSIGEP